jgi:teichuronic acid biosynthesis glycosyltransferase TuaC
MRILFLSSLYRSPSQPQRSIGNARILRAMRAHAEIRVMVPLPWYPSALAQRFPQLRAIADVPDVEIDDDDGTEILHPRTMHLPRFGRPLYAVLYGASMLAPIRAEVRRFKPDALLSAWAYPDGTAAVALGKILGLPTAVRVMGTDINDYTKNPWRRPQIAWAMRNTGRVIAVSKALAGEVESLGVDPGRIAVIPTGVDTSRFHPHDRREARKALGLPDGQIIVVPGRLSPEKGVHHFLDALAKLDPTVCGVLVGDGAQAAELREQAARLGLTGRVRFEGYQPEARMPLYYSAADLSCLASLEEGWPDALMESFACGCPVVASHVGGVPDIIALTGAGFTAPPGDAEGLAKKLAEGLARGWDRSATAETMRSYTLDRTAREYVETLRRAASG